MSDVDHRDLQVRIAAARAEVEANLKRLAETQARLNATREESASARSERERLHEFAFARLQAKLETLPVIEQAKGILIAQSGCQPEEAFDILRRASQRTNIKVRDLAAEIVRRAAKGAGSPEGARDRPSAPKGVGRPVG